MLGIVEAPAGHHYGQPGRRQLAELSEEDARRLQPQCAARQIEDGLRCRVDPLLPESPDILFAPLFPE